MIKHACFVTGTDTGIGKTFASCAMLEHLAGRGLAVVGMKPVAAGVEEGAHENEDVVRLMAASTIHADRALINPFRLKAPIAPHIAAADEGVELTAAPIMAALRALQEVADVVVVEGVGGFRVPLGARYDTAMLAVDLGLPVILVVGMKLGCINHALLSAEAIKARGLPLAGWIANRIDPDMLRADENIAALQQGLDSPLLATIDHLEDGRPAAAFRPCVDLLEHL